jgi:hypothetical protein
MVMNKNLQAWNQLKSKIWNNFGLIKIPFKLFCSLSLNYFVNSCSSMWDVKLILFLCNELYFDFCAIFKALIQELSNFVLDYVVD